MIRPNFIDEIDCGSFFDHIDDLLEFPGDDADAGVYGPCDNDAFPAVWSTDSDSLPCSDSVFSGIGKSDLSAELSVPYEDIVQLEWLSNFVEDSFSDKSLTIKKDESMMTKKEASSFRTSSPVSVLESSSSSSVSKTVPPSQPAQCGRARSKRARPAMFNPPRSVLRIISPTSSVTETTPSDPPCDSFAESRPLVTGQKPEKKKKKIKLASSAAPPLGGNVSEVPSSLSIRKCMHCEITKTPQWRAGPMGPKTLCNACGVRFKSGRLFPEYRPAASPTFVPSVHSNSHKKVTEMRSKCVKMDSPSSPELIPNQTAPFYSITSEILRRKPGFMKESL